MTKEESIKELSQMPGIGKSISEDLWNIGIKKITDLKGRDPEKLYNASNKNRGFVQDKCLLYAFRCAVYYASTPATKREPEKLKWWYWKDKK